MHLRIAGYRGPRSTAPSRLGSVVTVAVAAVALVVLGAPAEAARASTGTVATVPVTATSACQDVVFIAARGSGENMDGFGMGRPVGRAFSAFLSQAHASGQDLRVGYYALPYPALPVSQIWDPFWGIPVISDQSPYWSSVDLGVIETLGLMNNRSQRCDETYVLAGYSQGAMVVHRALLSLYHGVGVASSVNAGDRLLKRVSATIAIADGDRIGVEGGTHFGTAGTTVDNWGVSWGLDGNPVPPSASGDYPPFRETLPDDGRLRAASFLDVCLSGDLVCDFPAATARPVRGLHIHTDAYNSAAVAAGAAAEAYQLDVQKRAALHAARPWTVGPLTVHLSDNWGPVGSADPSSGWAADYTNQAPCTNCTTVPAPMIAASLGLSDYSAWCTASATECAAAVAGPRIGDAPAVTVGGRTPDNSGRAEMPGYAGTQLYWCFSAEKVCLVYQRATDSPELEISPALADVLAGASWGPST